MKRRARAILVTSAFAGFWGGALVLAWVVLPLVALAVRDEVRRIRACQRIVSATFRFFHAYMRALGLVDARVATESRVAPEEGPSSSWPITRRSST